jgi:polysaccharide biosynthesis protein PslA
MSGSKRIATQATLRTPRFTTSSFLIGAFAIALGCVALSLVGAVIGATYDYVAYGAIGSLASRSAVAGISIGLLYAVPFLAKRAYTIPGYLRGAHNPRRIFYAWNLAFLSPLVLAFLTQTTVAFSRVTTVVFYGAGLLAMLGLQGMIRRAIIAGLENGRLAPRRIMLVGHQGSIAGVSKRLATAVSEDERLGVRVVAVTQLPPKDGPGDLAGDLAHAVVMARTLLPDEIVIAASWNDNVTIDAAVRAFEQLPVAIHIDSGPVLARFSDLHLRRVGNISTVSVAELPLSPAAVIMKRAFDVVGASIGLLLVSPLLAVAALLIKWDSPGPVFFRQERRGFNQETFSIYKFRTMTAAPGNANFEQAKPGDARITRIGRILRRTSIDELPQLLNVLLGDMSLVGPRPHAVDHDRDFEHRIRRYPRRLNMKPGITGWAQVNGLRGLTDTDDKMKHRVEADLYYIDNWSILFDIYILVLTVLSPKTFNNAG